jgi:hypothetical protein
MHILAGTEASFAPGGKGTMMNLARGARNHRQRLPARCRATIQVRSGWLRPGESVQRHLSLLHLGNTHSS